MFSLPVSRLAGYVPALPSPFDKRGRVDLAAFARLCELQINEGANALVVADAAGEATSLDIGEFADLVSNAARIARKRVPILAGAISNGTMKAVALAQRAEASGADALVCVAPFYNKPTQAGVFSHFQKIAESTGLPIFLQDAPARTACPIADMTIVRLAAFSQFIGLIDASGDIMRPAGLRTKVAPEFRLFSGDDNSALSYLAQGGHGCISLASNIVPGLCRNMYLAYRHGQIARAQRLFGALAPLAAALSREDNPAALKAALSELGLISPALRLPLIAGNDEVAAIVARLQDCYADDLLVHARATSPLRAAAF